MIPIYVLNLARSPERRAFMAEGLARAGVEGEFVAAVDARACRSTRNPRSRLSAAETASVLSHRKAWRRLLRGGAACAVVLEDDAHLGEGFGRLLAADWSRLEFDAIKLETMFPPVWLARRSTPVGDRAMLRLGSEHLGAAGYLISRAGARKLLTLTRPLAECADQTLFGRVAILERQVVAYQLWPAIVVQDNVHPDPRARRAIASTLHEADRALLAEAARRAKPRGLKRLAREAGRLFQQTRRAWRFFLGWRRERVPWR